jgi:hypothetical protein
MERGGIWRWPLCALVWIAAIGTIPQPSVRLTNEQPTGSVAIGAETVRAQPRVASLTIVDVVNAEQTPVSVVAWIEWPSRGRRGDVRSPLGTLGLFPPDRGGRFALDASSAFAALARDTAADRENVRLGLELRRVHGERAWTSIAMTVTVEWRRE